MVIICIIIIMCGSYKGRFIGINSIVVTWCFICKPDMADTGAMQIAIIIIIYGQSPVVL